MHMHVHCVFVCVRMCMHTCMYICMWVDVIVIRMSRLPMIGYYMFILLHPKCVLRLWEHLWEIQQKSNTVHKCISYVWLFVTIEFLTLSINLFHMYDCSLKLSSLQVPYWNVTWEWTCRQLRGLSSKFNMYIC